jgi:hypothetical protein
MLLLSFQLGISEDKEMTESKGEKARIGKSKEGLSEAEPRLGQPLTRASPPSTGDVQGSSVVPSTSRYEKGDWLEQINTHWCPEFIQADGRNFNKGSLWNQMFSEIRKGHEAAKLVEFQDMIKMEPVIAAEIEHVVEEQTAKLKSDLEAAKFEVKCSDKDLEMEKAIRTAWENKANELLKAKIDSPVIRQLESDLEAVNKRLCSQRELEDKLAAARKQSESDSGLLKERHDKIDELWKELESKCSECIDLKMELSAARKEIAEANKELQKLQGEKFGVPEQTLYFKQMLEQARQSGRIEAIEELQTFMRENCGDCYLPDKLSSMRKSEKEEGK